MSHLDQHFLGESDEEQMGPKEGEGLLHSEPERAETDFFNGDKYVGDVFEGKRHGHGVYYYDSGDKYTGEWSLGKQRGHGVYVYANGDRYVGQWEAGKHNGEGTYYFKSGKVFTGTYVAGSPSGHGVFIYTNGERLDGEWSGSAYPEHGIYTYANGDSYGGSWKQGRKHGIGTYYFKSGAKYQGEYRSGEPHGNAIFIEPDGRAFEEVWASAQRKSRKLITTVGYTSGSGKQPQPSQQLSAKTEPTAQHETEASLLTRVGGAKLLISMEDDAGAATAASRAAPVSSSGVGAVPVAETVVGGDDLVL